MSTRARPAKKSAPTFDYFANIVRALLVESLGLSREDAAALALECAQEFGRKLGGVYCYMRKRPASPAARTGSVPRHKSGTITGSEEVLDVIARTTHDLLVERLGLDAQRAAGVAERCTLSISAAFRGELFYFPKGSAVAIQQRDEEIRASFNGRNYRELARAFNLSVPRIYIITRQRARQP